LCFELVGRRKAKEHEDEQKLRIDLSSTWEFPERERFETEEKGTSIIME
jgi:hypothetical protein